MNVPTWLIGALVLLVQSCSAAVPTPAMQAASSPTPAPCTGSRKVCGDQALELSSNFPEPTLVSIVNDSLARAEQAGGNHYPGRDGNDTYETTLEGQTYYIAANTYLLMNEKTMLKHPDKMNPGYCTFYLYDAKLQFVSSIHDMKIGDGKTTTCIDIFGVSGIAFHGQPAILAILQYFYTNGPIMKSIATIGDNWIQTAVLLPLVQQKNGKWTFTQDTSCFRSTNTIDTLAKAKAHLTHCR